MLVVQIKFLTHVQAARHRATLWIIGYVLVFQKLMTALDKILKKKKKILLKKILESMTQKLLSKNFTC